MLRIIEEVTNDIEVIFELPFRELLSSEEGTDGEGDINYTPANMEHYDDIRTAAIEDWNESNMSQYLDPPLKDVVTNMIMKIPSGRAVCNIVCTCIRKLSLDEIEQLKSEITGQMSDGWGEGFEQREVSKYRDEAEEELEDEDTGETYTESYPITVYVYGQFWWSDKNPRWYIKEVPGLSGSVDTSLDKPRVKMVGQDGNVFNLMGLASRALKNIGRYDQAKEMVSKITQTARSYDEAIRIMMEYVDIE